MTTVRLWTPSDIFQATHAMDRLMDEFFGPGGASAPAGGGDALPTYTLPVDILETAEAYVLTAPVAGFAPEQVEVTFAEGVLAISAKAEPLELQGTWLRQERPFGSWQRRLQLPQQVDAEKITAGFEHGLLTVTVPKAARPQPVRIAVGNGSASKPKQIRA